MDRKALFSIAINKNNEFRINKKNQSLSEENINELKRNKMLYPYLCKNRNQKANGWDCEDYDIMHNKKRKEFIELVNELDTNNISYIHIKGLAYTEFYPSFTRRGNGDFDICIRSIEDYWLTHRLLIDMGYQFDYFPILTKKRKKTFGLVKYSKDIDQSTSIFIEVNIGGFIIAEIEWLDFDDIYRSHKWMTIDNVNIRIPCDTITLSILLIELSSREKLVVRDAVDYHYLQKKTNFNQEILNNIISDSYLKDLHRKIKSFSINFKNVKPNKYKMIRHHIFPILLKEGNVFKKSYYLSIKKIGEMLYKKNIFLRIIKSFDYIVSPKNRYNNGIVTSFILINSNVIGDWKWYNFKNFELVITPIGVFWATNFGLIDEKSHRDLEKHILSIKDVTEKF